MFIKLTKNRFKFIQYLMFMTLITLSINTAAFAQDIPKIRELPSNPGSTIPAYKNDNNDIYKTSDITKKLEKNLTVTEVQKTAPLKSSVSELKAVVGKSQLMKFDEPIKRVSITDPSLADLVVISPKEIMINGKAGGETSLIIWGESNKPAMFNLFVQNDSINFIKEVKKLTPNDDIKIDFINSGGQSGMKVAISGRISSITVRDRIKALANAYGYTLIDNAESLTPQVMLSVKVVEINRNKVKNKNINSFSGPGTADAMTALKLDRKIQYIDPLTNSIVELTGNRAVAAIRQMISGIANGANTLIPNMNGVVDKVSQTSFDSSGFTFWKWNVDSENQAAQVLKIAETEGIVSILAEPRLMAITGQKASFNAGQQIPVVKGRDEYGGLIIDYKDSGINVDFTPTILEDSGRVLLKITPEMNEPTASAISTVDGFPIYGFTTRKTDTTVELEDNQTMVIGGLIKKKEDKQKTNVPYLSNLPIIGNLLNNSSYTKDETELMIFVTPTIIKPDDVVNGV